MGDPFLQINKTALSSDQRDWIEEQDSLKRRVVVEDDFTWSISSEESVKGEKLRYVGGVDLSFSKDDPYMACGALVIVDLDNLDVVHDDFSVVQLQVPYVPGFLAFREAPVLLGLLEKMKQDSHPFYPQLLMVDGNGLLHPRGKLWFSLSSRCYGESSNHWDRQESASCGWSYSIWSETTSGSKRKLYQGSDHFDWELWAHMGSSNAIYSRFFKTNIHIDWTSYIS